MAALDRAFDDYRHKHQDHPNPDSPALAPHNIQVQNGGV
jgi:hypothetical protein